MLGGIALSGGNYAKAIESFEELKPQTPFDLDMPLAMAYQLQGDITRAIEINQEHLYWSVTAALNSCSALIDLLGDSPEHLEAYVHAAEGMIEAFDLSRIDVFSELSLRVNAAVAYKQFGNQDRMYEELEHFVVSAQQLENMLSLDRVPPRMFDHLDDFFSPKTDKDDRELFENTTADLAKMSIAQMLLLDPRFADIQNESRFKAMVAKLHLDADAHL